MNANENDEVMSPTPFPRDAPQTGGLQNAVFESVNQSFVVEIRFEGGNQQSRQPSWRGRIKHIPSGAYRSIQDVSTIVDFIFEHLEIGGVKPPASWRIHRLLRAWLGR